MIKIESQKILNKTMLANVYPEFTPHTERPYYEQ